MYDYAKKEDITYWHQLKGSREWLRAKLASGDNRHRSVHCEKRMYGS
jgi:hypothetical protein